MAAAEAASVAIDVPEWYREALGRVMTNVARAQTTAEQRLESARVVGDREGEALALLVLSAARTRQNDLKGGMRIAEEAMAIAEQLGRPGLLLAARGVRAKSLHVGDDLVQAIEIYFQNLGEAERWRDSRTEREALRGLASAHLDLGDLDRALEFGQRALAAGLASDDLVYRGESAAVVASAYLQKGDRLLARKYFTQALEVYQKLGRRTPIADNEEAIAMIDFHDGKAEEALAVLDRVEPQRRSLRGRSKLTTLLVYRAEVLQKLGRLDEALRDLNEAQGIAETIDGKQMLASVYFRLSEVRAARGEFEEAYAVGRQYFAAQSELAGEAARRRVAELQTRYEVARKDEELARLTRDNEVRAAESRAREALLAKNTAELRAAESDLARSRAVRWSLIAGGVGSAVALGALVLALRTRLRAEHLRLEETRRAQVAAEEANSLKTQLLGIASHDLKSPLRAMLVRAEQLEPVLAESTAGTAALVQLRTDGERMLGIVHDLLDVAAIEAGELRLRFTPVDLGQVASDVVRALSEPAHLKSLTLTCAVPPAPAWVRGDTTRLHQVVTNLVDNAVKFSPPGKAVAVRVACDAADVIVSVRDEGPGISPEDLARMFQPFQTLSAVPTGGESSSGLGLHISREIVARHGGRIEVDSAPWKGATFSVVLPAAPPATAAAGPAAKTAHDIGL